MDCLITVLQFFFISTSNNINPKEFRFYFGSEKDSTEHKLDEMNRISFKPIYKSPVIYYVETITVKYKDIELFFFQFFVYIGKNNNIIIDLDEKRRPSFELLFYAKESIYNPIKISYKNKSRNIQEVLSKYKILDNSINNNTSNNNNIKIILDTKINNQMNNWNLTQKRYEKFLNINSNIKTNVSLNSKKIQNRNNSKKHSLNEARYEKKIKNEINNEKRKDISVELNHINAEKFINGFKGISMKQIEMIEKTINKNNMIITQETQNTNATNVYLDKNKNNNLTINMENNCRIETKDNDSTNFKTDQSKILKTDDIYQDLVNSLKNAPFKFKHK